MMRFKTVAAVAAAALALGGAPVLAEDEPGNEADMSVIINIGAEPLEIRIDAEDTNIEWNFFPGQKDGIDYSTTGVSWNVDVRTGSGTEEAKITGSTPGLDDPTILNDLVVEVALYALGFAGNADYDALFADTTLPCGYLLTTSKNSDPGPRERLGCRGMKPGFDSITGTNGSAIELETYGYLDGDNGGPTQRGTIQLDYTWIIEAVPEGELPVG
jgi:hypothetical protein